MGPVPLPSTPQAHPKRSSNPHHGIKPKANTGHPGIPRPRPVPYGHITLAVDHVKFQPFGIGHANYFRPSTQQKPLVSLHSHYYVEESDQLVGHPIGSIPSRRFCTY